MTDDEAARSHIVFTPADLARFIAEHGIAAELIQMHVATPTAPAAAAALGVATCIWISSAAMPCSAMKRARSAGVNTP